MQDSLFYDNQNRPLRNFITLRSNVSFGGTVGYVAFDSLINIKHQRSGINHVGSIVQHTPKPNDRRPNLLALEESNLLFSGLGYHQKDYNIYTWALLKQIDVKINTFATISNTTITTLANNSHRLFPNPASDWIYLKNNQDVQKNENIDILDFTGKLVLFDQTNKEGRISAKSLNKGL